MSGEIYRSASPKYANSRDLLTGGGSRRFGGRWNPVGIAAVYGSLTPETAMEETLAHARYYGLPVHASMPRTFVAISFALKSVLDLTACKIACMINQRGSVSPKRGVGSPVMPKKTAKGRKTSRKPPGTGKRTAQKAFRAAGGTATLPIVEDDSGRALQLRARLRMNRETFARLVPMSTRNLANIEGGRPPSATVGRRLNELKRIVDALAEVIQKDAIGPWLDQPNDAFGGLKPIEVIERGEVDRIWEMIFFLRSGVPS